MLYSGSNDLRYHLCHKQKLYSPAHMEPAQRRICSPEVDLQHALSALYGSGGKWSDLTLTCHGRQWPVHRAIVCPRSSFFDSACSQPFREASTRTIDLSDDDEDAVEQMVHFFYHLDYLNDDNRRLQPEPRHRTRNSPKRQKLDLSKIEDPLMSAAGCYTTPASSPVQTSQTRPLAVDKPSLSQTRSRSTTLESGTDSEIEPQAGQDDHLLLHCRVYALAEKYDIPPLKTLARRKFETAMACYYDSPDLPATIEEVYNSTIDSDRGLRNIVVQAFRAHPRLATTADVYAVIKTTPALAWDLYRVERGLPALATE